MLELINIVMDQKIKFYWTFTPANNEEDEDIKYKEYLKLMYSMRTESSLIILEEDLEILNKKYNIK